MAKAKGKSQSADFDSPWKEVLDRFLPHFVSFFFPRVHSAIDWSRGYTPRDKELQKVVRDAAASRRYADKLYQVWTLEGGQEHLFVHVEVQGAPETGFAARMFQYWHRIRDRYGKPLVSLAVLTDETPSWRPDRYEVDAYDCGVTFRFLAAKLLDWRGDWGALDANANPFAVVATAHLKAQETAGDTEARYRAKRAVTRGLYRRGYEKEDILELYRFIDWVLTLPEEWERQFCEEIGVLEEEEHMPYMSYVERVGYQKGQLAAEQTGERRVLERLLRRRFGKVPEWVEKRLLDADAALLEDWAEKVLDAKSLEEIFADDASPVSAS